MTEQEIAASRVEMIDLLLDRIKKKMDRIKDMAERPKRRPHARLIFAIAPISMWVRNVWFPNYRSYKNRSLIIIGAAGVQFIVTLPSFLHRKPNDIRISEQRDTNEQQQPR